MQSESLTHHADLKASAASCYAVVTDYEKYPDWMPEFKKAKITKKDGNVWDVSFELGILLKKIPYSIRIEQVPADFKTEWTFVKGEILDNTTGGWHFTPTGDKTCKVAYHASISIGISLAKPIVNKLTDMITGTTVPRLFKNLEARAQGLDRAKK